MSSVQDLTCAQVVELVTDYFEGALDASLTERFEEHLALCAGCDNYLDQVRQTIETAGRLRESEVPPQLREDLLRAFRGWNAGR
jgi:exonuclease VII small subunit